MPPQKRITLTRSSHKSQVVLWLHFPYDEEIIEKCRAINARWSQSNKCWYVPEEDISLSVLFAHFKGTAWVDAEAVWQNNSRKKEGPSTSDYNYRSGKSRKEKRIPAPNIRGIEVPEEYINTHKRIRSSEATLRSYVSALKQFIVWLKPRKLDDASDEDIRDYLTFLVKKRKLATKTQNQAISAIKFYFERVKHRELSPIAIERPKKEKKLPRTLSAVEVKTVLNNTRNIKHKAILAVIYSAGLRNGELVSLRKEDIKWDEGLISVRGGKGKKDRNTLLSKKVRPILKNYLDEYRPNYWLFEGPNRKKYSMSSVRQIFKRALRDSGLSEEYRVHDLRHSFASHAMEMGTPLPYVQELLGHSSSKTTEIYMHVVMSKFKDIDNPLDNIL